MSAVDWGTVIAAGITGLVGVAGIGGTLLSARMTSKSDAENLQTSIAAEDTRAKVAEKRRIYARCIASMIEVMAATAAFDNYGEAADEKERTALTVRIDESVPAMVNVVSEMWLAAPQALSQQTDNIARAMGNYALKIQRGAEADIDFFEMRNSLYRAMRADLGEPVSDEELKPPSALGSADAGHSDHGNSG